MHATTAPAQQHSSRSHQPGPGEVQSAGFRIGPQNPGGRTRWTKTSRCALSTGGVSSVTGKTTSREAAKTSSRSPVKVGRSPATVSPAGNSEAAQPGAYLTTKVIAAEEPST